MIKDFPNYEDTHLVSSDGRYFRKSNNRELSLSKDKDGYRVCKIMVNNKNKDVRIHRAVAEAFIPNPECKPCVNHIDGNKNNNNVSNLEWCTIRENNIHAFKTGLMENSLRNRRALSREQEIFCVKAREFGVSLSHLAKEFNTTKTAIKRSTDRIGGNFPSLKNQHNRRGLDEFKRQNINIG